MQPTFYARSAPVAALAFGFLPLSPPNALLAMLMKHMCRRHADVVERLRPIAGTSFAIRINDLDVTLSLKVTKSAVTAHFVRKPHRQDVTISGTLPVLVAMAEGEMDGDALFFARELTISGDTEALLTLRNALDSADFSLRQEILAATGPLGTALEHAKRALFGPHHREQNWQSGHP